jgi:hypothetical protein
MVVGIILGLYIQNLDTLGITIHHKELWQKVSKRKGRAGSGLCRFARVSARVRARVSFLLRWFRCPVVVWGPSLEVVVVRKVRDRKSARSKNRQVHHSHSTNLKRDIVDRHTHAPCAFGLRLSLGLAFSYMWGVVSRASLHTTIDHWAPHTQNTIGGF